VLLFEAIFWGSQPVYWQDAADFLTAKTGRPWEYQLARGTREAHRIVIEQNNRKAPWIAVVDAGNPVPHGVVVEGMNNGNILYRDPGFRPTDAFPNGGAVIEVPIDHFLNFFKGMIYPQQ
jgi:hypothetical protein